MKSLCIKKILLTLAVFILLPSALFAFNFGLLVNANAGYGNAETAEENFDYQIDIFPRFSTLVGDNGEFLMSAGFTFGMEHDEFYYVPELLQTSLTMRFGNSGFKAGRFNYSAPLSFIAEGLFDGFQFFYNSDIGNFHIGAWYTGFLYKNNLSILMTDNDRAVYSTFVDYGDFLNTYFAPKRVFASIGWAHPSVGEIVRLNAEVIGQIDLTEKDAKYHSQYIILKAGVPIKSLFLELGGSLEIYQTSDEVNIALAGEFGLYSLFSTGFNNQLSFTGRVAGGKVEDFCGAFVPITTKYYGYLFQKPLSGLSVFTLNYSGRLAKELGVSLNAAYFVRGDFGTYNGFPVSDDGYFLGPDFSAKVIWSPVSDLQFIFIGGVFVPALGDAGPEEKLRWRVELTATMTVF